VAERTEQEAVQAIRQFLSPAATRADASDALAVWQRHHAWRLDELDWAAVLAQFDATGWPATLHTNGSTP
jgi:hypothetical protein